MYLEAASFRGIQDKELFEQVLAVRGHVERNPVFATQHALSQLLAVDKNMVGQQQVLKNPPCHTISYPKSIDLPSKCRLQPGLSKSATLALYHF